MNIQINVKYNPKTINKIFKREYSTNSNIDNNIIEDEDVILIDSVDEFIKEIDLNKLFPNNIEIFQNMLEHRNNITLKYKNISGIYCLYNKITKQYYIGSALNLSKRLSEYYFASKLKSNRPIEVSINSYGHNNFAVIIVETFLNKDKNYSINREQYYFDRYNCELNSLKLALSSQGFKHSEETKKN